MSDTVRQYDMLNKGEKVLAAVSGGSDSVCMLKTLLALRREPGIEVVVGNMDHAIRGKESEKDSAFVKRLAEGLGLKFVHRKINVRSGAKDGRSLEERAREKRYAFLKKAALDNGCGVIATGHTIDDQAETVLMRTVFGSSLAGMTGIPPVRYEDGLRIIRPLIRVEKRDVLCYLEKTGGEYVEDCTNLDIRHLRNKVRLEIIPFLEKYNPRLKRSLANLSDTLREDFVFLKTEKEKISGRHAKERKGLLSIDVKDFILQPRALRKEIFKELFRKAGGNIKKLTYRHWMDMDYFLRAAEKGKSLDFPGDIRVAKRDDTVTFSKRRVS